MPLKPRMEYEGAFYHIITRGTQGQKTFKGSPDFQKFIEFLAICRNRSQYSLSAHVLMSNHDHLLMETRETPFSKILQSTQRKL